MDFLMVDADGERPDRKARISRGSARSHVEPPPVQRTDDLLPQEFSFSESAAVMRARILKRADRPTDVRENDFDDLLPFELHRRLEPFGKIVLSHRVDPSGHGRLQTCFRERHYTVLEKTMSMRDRSFCYTSCRFLG